MARALRGVAGGIASLDALIEAHPQAIRADLIDRGKQLEDLGTPALSWANFAAIVAWLPPASALGRTFNPDWMWGLQEMLLADVVDSLRWLVWAKTKDAQKGRNRPKPVPRPGVPKPERIGDKASVADMNQFLGWEV